MAHYAQTVNVIGCVKTTKTAATMATTGLPLTLYRQHFGVIPIDTQVAEPLDVVAALTEDGDRLTIGIVNPTEDVVTLSLQVEGISLAGKGTYWEIAADSPKASNEPGVEPRVNIRQREVETNVSELKGPAVSVVLYSLAVK